MPDFAGGGVHLHLFEFRIADRYRSVHSGPQAELNAWRNLPVVFAALLVGARNLGCFGTVAGSWLCPTISGRASRSHTTKSPISLTPHHP